MKPADNIEKSIKNLRYPAGAKTKEQILQDALTVLSVTNKTQSATQSLNFWRILMKCNITKFAAAAVILMAVLIGINQLGSPIDGASVAWSQVVEQLNKHEKYKCRQRVVREQGPEYPAMNVYHLNLSQRRQEVKNGDIHIIDMRGEDAITLELKPAEMKAIVTKLIGFGPQKDPDIIEMVKRFEQESTERLGTKEVNGKILQGFRHQPNQYNDFIVWVDAKTKLPVEIELKHPEIGQTIFMDEFEFDFDLPLSAFSTNIPAGYKVENLIHDYRPVESKEIAAEDIQSKLNHTAYTVEKLPWIKKITSIEIVDPLGTRAIEYITGIQSDDENTIILVQGDYYDKTRMVWIPQQQRVLECSSGIELYTHPNGSIYAQLFLESLAKANPGFFDSNNLSEERFTRMIVMPNGTVMGLAVNKQMGDNKLQELVESLVEINPVTTDTLVINGPTNYTLADNSKVILSEKAQIRLYKDNEKRGFEHIAGRIEVEVAKNKGEFIVMTPYGTAKALGTVFTLDLLDTILEGDSENTALLSVQVKEGSVEVSNEHGSVILKEKHQATVEKDQPPYDFRQDKGLPPRLIERIQLMLGAFEKGDARAWANNYNINAFFDLAKGKITFSEHRDWFSGMSEEDAQHFIQGCSDVTGPDDLLERFIGGININEPKKIYVRGVVLTDDGKHALANCIDFIGNKQYTSNTPQWTYFNEDWWQTDD